MEIKKFVFESLLNQKVFIADGGPFLASGGLKLPFYVDIRRIASDPVKLKKIAKHFASKLKESECEYIGGIETGGISLALAISLEAGIPFFYIRKEPQDHGLCSVVAGLPPKKDAKIAIVDDSVGEGKTITKVLDNLNKEGYTNIKLLLYIIDADLMDSAHNRTEELKKKGIESAYIGTIIELAEFAEAKQKISKQFKKYLYNFFSNPYLFIENNEIENYFKDHRSGLIWAK